MKPKKIAVVAEWLTWRGGGESVLDEILNIFPEATLFTTVYNEKNLPEYKKFKPKTSFLQKVPIVNKKHQALPPLLLKAISSLDLTGYDLIISLSSAIGKGITKPKESIHVCYCHTPMRYVWQTDIDDRLIRIPFGRFFINYLKAWDLKTNKSVDYFIANSQNTADKIKLFYHRDSSIIHPPVELERPLQRAKTGFYLCLSRLVPYKRFDLAVEAFNQNGEKLIIAGDGPESAKLSKIAKDNIKFLGRVDRKKKLELLCEANALIFPAEEDFGIVPIEAMSQGTPVIAFGKGGAKETVDGPVSGLFFENQSSHSINEAIEKFKRTTFDKNRIIAQSKKFASEVFRKKMIEFIKNI